MPPAVLDGSAPTPELSAAEVAALSDIALSPEPPSANADDPVTVAWAGADASSVLGILTLAVMAQVTEDGSQPAADDTPGGLGLGIFTHAWPEDIDFEFDFNTTPPSEQIAVPLPLGDLSFTDPSEITPQEAWDLFTTNLAQTYLTEPPSLENTLEALGDTALDIFDPDFNFDPEANLTEYLYAGSAGAGAALLYHFYGQEILPNVTLPLGEATIFESQILQVNVEPIVGHAEDQGYFSGGSVDIQLFNNAVNIELQSQTPISGGGTQYDINFQINFNW